MAILTGGGGAVTVWAVTPAEPTRERTWITATLYYVGFLALFFGLGCFGSAEYLSVQAARAQNERAAAVSDTAGRRRPGSIHKVDDPKDFMAAGTVLLGGGMVLLGMGHALARRGW